MGAQLNIKDPETVRLARELAGQTGRSVTETIRAALEREVHAREMDAEGRQQAFQRMIGGSRRLWKDELVTRDHDDLLYDENGLPR